MTDCTHILSRTITLEFTTDCHIDDARREAATVSLYDRGDVVFEFNDDRYTVKYRDLISQVKQ